MSNKRNHKNQPIPAPHQRTNVIHHYAHLRHIAASYKRAIACKA